MDYAFSEGWKEDHGKPVFKPLRLSSLQRQHGYFETVGILFGRSDGPRNGRKAPEVVFHDKGELGYVTRGLKEGVDYTQRPIPAYDDCEAVEMVVRNPALQAAFENPLMAADPEHCRAFVRGFVSDAAVRSAHDPESKEGHHLVMWNTQNEPMAEAACLMLDVVGIPYLTNHAVPRMTRRERFHYKTELLQEGNGDRSVWPPPGKSYAVLFANPTKLRDYVIPEAPFSDSMTRLDTLVDHMTPEGSLSLMLRAMAFRREQNLTEAQRLQIINTEERALKHEFRRIKDGIRDVDNRLAKLTAAQRNLDEYDGPDPNETRRHRIGEIEAQRGILHQRLEDIVRRIDKPAKDVEEAGGRKKRKSRWSWGRQQYEHQKHRDRAGE